MATLTREKVATRTASPSPRFNLNKCTQAAATIVSGNGRRMGLDRLMLTMYIVDRRLIDRLGRGLTSDDYVAFKAFGAVPIGLSRHALDEKQLDSNWHRHLEIRGDYYVTLLSEPVDGALSKGESAVVDEVLSDYAGLEWDDFRAKLNDEAPEGHNEGAPVDFTLKDLLVALGENDEDAEAAFQDFDSWRNLKYGRAVA